MKYVYVIKHYVPYESDDVIGIWASKKAALKAAERKKIKLQNNSFVFQRKYYIERYEVNNWQKQLLCYQILEI